MLLARSLRLAFAALLTLHLASAFAAIFLLGRMRPALESILERNVHSLTSVEVMLGVLAAQGGESAADESRTRFAEALRSAESNLTEPGEPEVLAAIRERSPEALAGDPNALADSIDALLRLGEINRAAIERADRDAQRLANAGAWAVVFLALGTLGTGVLAIRQLDQRVLAPLGELHDVLARVRRGDALRRCRPPLGASAELAESMRALNTLLDEVAERRVASAPSASMDAGLAKGVERATLLSLLDRQPQPTVLLDAQGSVVAASKAALELLATQAGAELRDRLRAVAHGGPPPDGIEVTPVADARRFVCTLRAQPA